MKITLDEFTAFHEPKENGMLKYTLQESKEILSLLAGIFLLGFTLTVGVVGAIGLLALAGKLIKWVFLGP